MMRTVTADPSPIYIIVGLELDFGEVSVRVGDGLGEMLVVGCVVDVKVLGSVDEMVIVLVAETSRGGSFVIGCDSDIKTVFVVETVMITGALPDLEALIRDRPGKILVVAKVKTLVVL